MKKKWFWPKTCFRSGLNGTQFCLVKSNFNDRRRYFRTISVCVNETIDLLSSFEQEQKKKKLNRIHILNHTSSRAANYLYSAPMKWARQVNDHSRATERTNTEKRTNTHFPNKEIDFYNWRQLRHTAEFIFQFMFWMRNCFARTYHIHCDWINDGIGVREWRFCSRTSLIIIISDSKMFFFWLSFALSSHWVSICVWLFTAYCCCSLCCWLVCAFFLSFILPIDWIDQTAIKMECIRAHFSCCFIASLKLSFANFD